MLLVLLVSSLVVEVVVVFLPREAWHLVEPVVVVDPHYMVSHRLKELLLLVCPV